MTQSNDTAPDGPGITACVSRHDMQASGLHPSKSASNIVAEQERPCPTTSLPTIAGALHGTPLPNGTVVNDGRPSSSWTSIGIPKEKLVMALGFEP